MNKWSDEQTEKLPTLSGIALLVITTHLYSDFRGPDANIFMRSVFATNVGPCGEARRATSRRSYLLRPPAGVTGSERTLHR